MMQIGFDRVWLLCVCLGFCGGRGICLITSVSVDKSGFHDCL